MGKYLVVKDMEKCVGCYSCMYACAREVHNSISLTKTAIHIRTSGGIEGSFAVVACRFCEDPPCAAVCPTEALIPREGGGVILIPNKCIGCEKCVKACIVHAIEMDPETNLPVICVNCGRCAEYCPTGAIAFEEVDKEVF